jgi:hypothetical protein
MLDVAGDPGRLLGQPLEYGRHDAQHGISGYDECEGAANGAGVEARLRAQRRLNAQQGLPDRLDER